MADDTDARWLHPGFTRDSVLNYLFKKSIHRVDTSLRSAYYQEVQARANVFLDYLATDAIPQNPPDDFVELTPSQIAAVFGINESEVSEFDTTINGTSVFSIERSASHPQILKINNLRMKPEQKNINGAFTGFSSRSQINLISQAIFSTYGNGDYNCVFKRSAGDGVLSKEGYDVVNVHQVAHMFDWDNGILTLHEEDKPSLSPNTILWSRPPIISCYVYRGSFGRLGWIVRNNALICEESQVLLGKTAITDPTLLMDISGSAVIEDLTVNSITTYSDERLKTNIEFAPVNKKILELKPMYYSYKTSPGVKEYGLIAQDVQKVAPDIVKDGEHLSVQYDRLGVYLLPIVKEQQSRIEILEKQMEALTKLLLHR